MPFNTTLGVNAELPLVALVGEDLRSLLCGADRVHDQLQCEFRLRCRVVRVVREVVLFCVNELAVGAVASVEQNCPAVAVPAQKKRKLSSAILRRLGREEGGGGGCAFLPSLLQLTLPTSKIGLSGGAAIGWPSRSLFTG